MRASDQLCCGSLRAGEDDEGKAQITLLLQSQQQDGTFLHMKHPANPFAAVSFLPAVALAILIGK